jgi:hypothetical protein
MVMSLQHKIFLAVVSICVGWTWLFLIADSDGREYIEGATAMLLMFGGAALTVISLVQEHDRKQFEKTED